MEAFRAKRVTSMVWIRKWVRSMERERRWSRSPPLKGQLSINIGRAVLNLPVGVKLSASTQTEPPLSLKRPSDEAGSFSAAFTQRPQQIGGGELPSIPR